MSSSEQDFLAELRKVFVIEGGEHLRTIVSGLGAIQAMEDPAERQTVLDSMHRAAHTLKGNAWSVNLDAIGTVCQSLEHIFSAMNTGVLVPAVGNLAVLRHAADSLGQMLGAPPGEPEADVSELVAQLAALAIPGTMAPILQRAPAAAPAPCRAGKMRPPPASQPQEGEPGFATALSMTKPLKALVIEDSECDYLLLRRQLQKGGYDVSSQRVQDAAALTTALTHEHWDVVFSDHNMPTFNSTEALKIIKATQANLPFIIVSGSIGEDVAVAAMKAGAQDYLIKGHLARLVAAVERELQEAKDRQARHDAEFALLAQKEDLRIAREIQEHLFPAAAPILQGFDIAGATCPAEATGGDYYDFIHSPREEMFVVIGDVSGHGLGPALLMADVRAYLRAFATDHTRIPDVLDHTNRLLRDDLGDDRFITMLFAGLNPSTCRLHFINAGHPPGYVLDRNGVVKTELTPCVPALGLDPDVIFPEAVEVPLVPSDLIVFLTDGVIEAADPSGEEFGIARVLDLVRRERYKSASGIISILFDAVRDFTGASSLQDDLSAVIIKVSPE
jgi:serine phosphatase RsbU (regulator of sigma subunit)/HPt (histidine-containing phosphotransfer) domain-containing protein